MNINALKTSKETVLEDTALTRDFLDKMEIARNVELIRDYRNCLYNKVATFEGVYLNNYLKLSNTN